MTSATERLRALLTERGVEWWQSANTLGCVFTRWYSPLFGDEVCAMENGEEGLVLFDHFVTPEQAIAATLGRGTCRMERVDDEQRILHGWLECSECGPVYPPVNDAIAKAVAFCPFCGRKVVE